MKSTIWTVGVVGFMVACVGIVYWLDHRYDRHSAPTEVRSTGTFFNCYKAPQHGNPERECSIKLLALCGPPLGSRNNCFTQDRAFCFYAEHKAGGKQWICLATEQECDSWHRDEAARAEGRSGVPVGPCIGMSADEPSLSTLE